MGTVHPFRYMRDQLVNFVTGLGTWKDATSASFHNLTLLNRNEVENAYRSDWISRKIVDAPAEDATREWRQWQASGRQIEAIEAEEKRHELQKKLRMAIIRARLYGGAALVLGVDQGEPQEELDVETVGKGGLKFVVVLNRYELQAGPRIYNVDSQWYTRPSYYTVSTPLFGFSGETGNTYPGGAYNALVTVPNQSEGDHERMLIAAGASGMVKVHPSRVIELVGNELPDWRLAPMGGGWGDSVLQTVDEAIKDWGLVMGGMASMVNDAKMDVIKINDFSKNIATAEYAQRLLTRFQMANASKSTINSILLDKEEEWERIQTNFGGLPQLLREFMMVVAAAGGLPPSRIFGQSISKGLGGGTGGEDDLRNYYDDVASKQKTVISPALIPLDQCVVRSALGRYDPKIHYQWNPLWQQEPNVKADIALKKAQTTKVYVDSALFNEEMLRKVVINQWTEDMTYPGVEDAVAEFNEGEPDIPMARVWSPGIDPHTGEPVGPPKPAFGGGGGGPPPPGGPPPGPGGQDVPPTQDAGPDDEPRDEHGRWTAGAQHGLPEGSKFTEGKGQLGRGKFGVVLPGESHMVGNLHPTTEAAAAEARSKISTRVHVEQSKAERASSVKALAGRLKGGGDPTSTELKMLGLRERSDLKYFIPAASEVFGISSRAVRPHIASLIRTGSTDFGAKIESVHSATGLKAIGAALKHTKDAGFKETKAEADYTDGPVSEEACWACSMFVEPGACTKVDGTISRNGHCRYWEADVQDHGLLPGRDPWSANNTSGKASGGQVYNEDPDALERDDEGSPEAIKAQRKRIKAAAPKERGTK